MRPIVIPAAAAMLGACEGAASPPGEPGTFVTLPPGSILPGDSET